MARPGGNITGLDLTWQDLSEKWLELLKEVRSKVLTRGCHLGSGRCGIVPSLQGNSESAAQTLGVKLQSLEVRGPNPDFESALKTARQRTVCKASLWSGTPIYRAHRTRLVNLAEKSRLPAVYDDREFVEAGGLMSYGPNRHRLVSACRHITWTRILKGAKPADLPVERPMKFELIINLERRPSR